MKLTHLHNRLFFGSNATHFSTTVSQRSSEDKISTLKSFDERIIDCTYTIHEHLLGIAVCSLIMLKEYTQSLTNANIFGQGNLNLVSEKSGKSQGILLSLSCGNPVKYSNLFVQKMDPDETASVDQGPNHLPLVWCIYAL